MEKPIEEINYDVNNVLEKYEENQLIDDLIFDNLKLNSSLPKYGTNQISYNNQYNEIHQNSQKTKLIKMLLPQKNKINQENNKP